MATVRAERLILALGKELMEERLFKLDVRWGWDRSSFEPSFPKSYVSWLMEVEKTQSWNMPEVQATVTIGNASTEVRVISTEVKWKYGQWELLGCLLLNLLRWWHLVNKVWPSWDVSSWNRGSPLSSDGRPPPRVFSRNFCGRKVACIHWPFCALQMLCKNTLCVS